MTHAVVLAAGRGTRMRAASSGVTIDPAQQHAADRGLKALIPFHGHPFLSYLLTSLADAGCTDVCIVVGPGDDPIRAHYAKRRLSRLRIRFAVQEAPLGSANALAQAEPFCDDHDFAVVNSDNHYPPAALRALDSLDGSGLTGFTRSGLAAGNIDPERVTSYAIIETDAQSRLTAIVEKPDAAQLESAGPDPLISMTCWRFARSIFYAIRDTPLSPRGEYELPDAVRLLMKTVPVNVHRMSAAVLDLSRRDDIPRVAELLRNERVDL